MKTKYANDTQLGASLRKRRRWFTQDSVPPEPNGEDPATTPVTPLKPNEPGKADASKDTDQAKINGIVEGRLAEDRAARDKALVDKYGDLNALKALADKQLAKQDAEKTDLERAEAKVSELEGVGQENETLKAEVTKLQEFIGKILETRMKDVPQSVKDLMAPLPDDLAKLEWLEKHGDSLVAGKKPPKTGAKAGSVKLNPEIELDRPVRI